MIRYFFLVWNTATGWWLCDACLLWCLPVLICFLIFDAGDPRFFLEVANREWLFVIFAIERFMLVSLYFILLLNDTYTRHVDLILLLPLVPTGPVFYFGSVA